MPTRSAPHVSDPCSSRRGLRYLGIVHGIVSIRFAAALLGVASVAACGRVGFDGVGQDGGAAPADAAVVVDAEAPTLVLSASSSWGARSVDLEFTLSEDGAVHLLVDEPGLAADGASIRDAATFIVSASAGQTLLAALGGLSPATKYVLYAVGEREGELSNVYISEPTATQPLFREDSVDFADGPLPYAVYLPEDYYREPEKARPTIVFLHGSGAVNATPGELPMHDGMFREIAAGANAFAGFPFIVVAPICQSSLGGCFGWTKTELVDVALEHALERYPIDEKRLYFTGLSTGGQGVFEYAVAHPERVAAAVPIASTFREELAGALCEMSSVPVWAFHSELDTLQPPENSLEYIKALGDCVPAPEPAPRLDMYPWEGGTMNHAGWVEVYGDDHAFTLEGHSSIYTWFLAHSL